MELSTIALILVGLTLYKVLQLEKILKGEATDSGKDMDELKTTVAELGEMVKTFSGGKKK
jgi:hypothetical protein